MLSWAKAIRLYTKLQVTSSKRRNVCNGPLHLVAEHRALRAQRSSLKCQVASHLFLLLLCTSPWAQICSRKKTVSARPSISLTRFSSTAHASTVAHMDNPQPALGNVRLAESLSAAVFPSSCARPPALKIQTSCSPSEYEFRFRRSYCHASVGIYTGTSNRARTPQCACC